MVGKEGEELLKRLLRQVARRVGETGVPPPLVSDGKRGYSEAVREAFGWVPPYRGRGRPPTKKRPLPGLCYAQLVKRRRRGRVVAVEERLIFGDPQEAEERLGKVNLSRVERTQLTSRQSNGRLVRKTLSFSKRREMLEWACAWEDLVYNFAKPPRTLRLPVGKGRWLKQTPAMAAGLTDHIWTMRELVEFMGPLRN